MVKNLDFIFPWIVFFYGVFMVFSMEFLDAHASSVSWARNLLHQLQMRRGFAWLCFFIGGLWSLQNIWL